jgi:hypothetical protein
MDTPTLPLEISHMILRYSISAPDFFDPNIGDRIHPWNFLLHEWSSLRQYQESEMNRKCLRMVCRSWNAYLRRYEHRHVRIEDVAHGRVPLQHLKFALRISFGHHKDSYCSMCQPELHFQDSGSIPRGKQDEYYELCTQIFHLVPPLNVEILHFATKVEQVLIDRCILPFSFSKVVAIHTANCEIGQGILAQLIGSLPSFRYSLAACIWTPSVQLSLRSSILTTLILAVVVPLPYLQPLTHEHFYIPSLRHLDLQFLLAPMYVPDEPRWLPILRVIGSELKTLRITQVLDSARSVSGEIWTVCPKLEHLHLGGNRDALPPPPPHHPLHTLGIPYLDLRFRYPFSSYVPDWPGLRTVQVDQEWVTPIDSSQLETLDSRLRLEDLKGESYADFLLRTEQIPDPSVIQERAQ